VNNKKIKENLIDINKDKKNDAIVFGIIWALVIFSFGFTCVAIRYAYSIEQKTVINYTSIQLIKQDLRFIKIGIEALLKHNKIEGISYEEK
jgi:hypothetical protein